MFKFTERCVLFTFALLFLSACSGLWNELADAPKKPNETGSVQTSRQESASRPNTIVGALIERSHNETLRTPRVERRGSDQFLRDPTSANQPTVETNKAVRQGQAVTLNLANVEIAQAAKTVMGDMLGLNFVVDPKVSGQITVRTSQPVRLSDLADIFDAALRANGAAIVDDGTGTYKIVLEADAIAALPALNLSRSALRRRKIGLGIQIVPLAHLSVSDMQRILQPIAPKNSILLADEGRNLLMLQGNRRELATLMETIEIFDVDWMKAMSFALVPLQTSDPETISQELRTVFSAMQKNDANSVVRFVPNNRLRSILVIASRALYVSRAKAWIKRLDAAAAGAERTLHVYEIQNRTASELAALLQKVFEGEEKKLEVSTPVAPKFSEAETTFNGSGTNSASIPPASPSIPANTGPPNSGALSIVADEANNAILIYANRRDYRRIRQMLRELDTIQNQVLLAATIAEISLRDELNFGLRWFLEQGGSRFTFSDVANGAVASAFPGFSWIFSSARASVVLNAVSGVTDVEVLSSPTLMVMDNRTAELQVGDQVPIATQSAVSVTDPDAPIVNRIELRDTGVILRVTPRVNDSGRVILEIEQEVSDVIATTTSGIDSPTIQQRKLKTTVVVNDGDSIALGGLIQRRHSDGRTKVPLAGDIPVVGSLFRNKTDTVRKTELLILITPRVVRDLHEARNVTAEFRRQLDIAIPELRKGRRSPKSELRRILH